MGDILSLYSYLLFRHLAIQVNQVEVQNCQRKRLIILKEWKKASCIQTIDKEDQPPWEEESFTSSVW